MYNFEIDYYTGSSDSLVNFVMTYAEMQKQTLEESGGFPNVR
jgi:hypothetical protein